MDNAMHLGKTQNTLNRKEKELGQRKFKME